MKSEESMRQNAMESKADRYEKLGMDSGNAMRLANLERLKKVTTLSSREEQELKELQQDLQRLEGRDK